MHDRAHLKESDSREAIHETPFLQCSEITSFSNYTSEPKLYHGPDDNEINIPYCNQVETFPCDSEGGEYNVFGGISIKVPKNAVGRGKPIHIKAAVTLHGPFEFSPNKRPISPILWLCIQESSSYIFNEPIEVTIPHILCFSDNQSAKRFGIEFAKADHNISSNHSGEKVFRFKAISDCSLELRQSFASLQTKHCCFLCLQADSGITREITSKALYCLSQIEPTSQQPPDDHRCTIYFCFSYLLDPCQEVIDK